MNKKPKAIFCVLGAAALTACASTGGRPVSGAAPEAKVEPNPQQAFTLSKDARHALQTSLSEHDVKRIGETDFQSRTACIAAEVGFRRLGEGLKEQGVPSVYTDCTAADYGTIYEATFMYGPAPQGKEFSPSVTEIRREFCTMAQQAYDSAGVLREIATGRPPFSTRVMCLDLGSYNGIVVQLPVPGISP